MSDTTISAVPSGTFSIGGDLPVVRLGYGAMQITGPGVWGPPRDHAEALAVLRRAVELGVNFIDTADSYGPYVSEELIREATLVEGEAVDLYHFTRLLGRALDEKGRARIVEMLWEMTYADGRATEFEDNIIWRVADLLGVSSSERIALRQQVAAAAGVPARGSEGE